MKRWYPWLSTAAIAPLLGLGLWRSDLRPGLLRRFWPETIRLDESGGAGPRLWVHAASAGEVQLANKFAADFLAAETGARLLLTTNTESGMQASSGGPWAFVRRYPFDTYPALDKLFREFKPQAIVTIEMELWPGLFDLARRRGVPVLVINARLAPASIDPYRQLNRVLGGYLQQVYYCTRIDDDLKNLEDLGIPIERMLVTGEMKIDRVATAAVRKRQTKVRGQALLAVSTHSGEDEILLDAFVQLRDFVPGLQLILAPRHGRRAKGVAELVAERGFRVGLASQKAETDLSVDVIVEDGFGRMERWYERAAVAFVGGSLVDRGGHNILEPILQMTPVLTGRYHANWAPWVTLLDELGALSVVTDADDIARVAAIVLDEWDKVEENVRLAKNHLIQHVGTTRRNVAIVREILNGGDPFGGELG